MNTSLGPNSVPIYILKVYNSSKIINLSFATGIFPDLCKIGKVVPFASKYETRSERKHDFFQYECSAITPNLHNVKTYKDKRKSI